MAGGGGRAWGLVLAALVAVSAAGLAACSAPAPPPQPSLAPVQRPLGSVAVVPLPSTARPHLQTPAKGGDDGALSGAGQGALASMEVGLRAGLMSGHPIAFAALTALGVALAPIAAIAGGVIGAQNAHPAHEVAAAEVMLARTLSEADPAADLRQRIISIAEATTIHQVAARPRLAPGRGYSDLREHGFDTALEIKVVRLALEGQGEIDPVLALTLGVQARLVALDTLATLDERTWRYTSERRGFFEWAAEGAQPLRAALARGTRELAVDVVSAQFLAGPTAPLVWSSPTPACAQARASASKNTPRPASVRGAPHGAPIVWSKTTAACRPPPLTSLGDGGSQMVPPADVAGATPRVLSVP